MRTTSLSIIVSFLICVLITAALSACTDRPYPGQVPDASTVTAVPTAQIIGRPSEQPREVVQPQPTASTPDYTVQSSDVPIANTSQEAPASPAEAPAEPDTTAVEGVPTAQVVGRPTEQPREVVIPTPAAGTSEQPEQY